MKKSSLVFIALMKGNANADVLMATSSTGEHLALHGISRPFHHVHRFQSDLSPVRRSIGNVHEVCQADAIRFCQDGPNLMSNDPFLAQLMKEAAIHQELPVFRMAFPQKEDTSLKLLNELMPISPLQPSGVVRIQLIEREPTDVNFEQLMEELLSSSVAFSKSIAPPSEQVQLTVIQPNTNEQSDEQKTDVAFSSTEDVAEKTLEVLVNSLLDHASSASSDAENSASEDETEVAIDINRFDPVFMSKQISQFGNKIIDNEDESEDESEDQDLRRRLARRLTEVTPFRGMHPCGKVIRIHPLIAQEPPLIHPLLNFGPVIDRCLWNAFDSGKVSGLCGLALKKAIESVANFRKEQEVSHQQTSSEPPRKPPCYRLLQRKVLFLRFFRNFLVSFIIYFLIASLFRQFMFRKKRCNKRKKVMRAIHTNPQLKAAVESAIGENLDDLPHRHRSSGNSCVSFCDSVFSFLPLVGLNILLMFTAIVAPYFVIFIGAPILALTSCYMLLRKICFFTTTTDNDDDYVVMQDEESTRKSDVAETDVYEGVPVQVV
eukprot:CAMPEP_0197827788 /NCGR_PEP_ID=MMETSP1437-20131217/4495_1 /TAXON_ID=49252 ORGANISM="Eucampia antarctica, Strain CCMP1452" /NCGR_SAMPLE_ID=MMETSP1437 /ASSEMBLY_ACC=CAM_ASM_001096 /LENGTH=545 /DNA_ID=CAMNT_0043428775 /DNA_START=98 /DNA_END=1735 /DNA_ORIENTATION=-